MAKYEYNWNNKTINIDEGEFAQLLTGGVIAYAHFSQEDGFDLALDTSGKVHFRYKDGDLRAFYSDYHTDQTGRLNLFRDKENPPTLAQLQARIDAIRYLHVLIFLLQSDRIDDLKFFLSEGLRVESKILKEEEQLRILSAGVGSFWASLFTKSGDAAKSLFALTGLFYDKGRTAMLDRLRAKADSDMIDVERKAAEVESFRLQSAVDIIRKAEKIKDPALRQATLSALRHSMEKLGRKLPEDLKGITREDDE
jgi:hypothetical protein